MGIVLPNATLIMMSVFDGVDSWYFYSCISYSIFCNKCLLIKMRMSVISG